MMNIIVATSIALSMVIIYLLLTDEDDDFDGGKMIPAYQTADK